MVFNWFKRQLGQPAAESAAETIEPQEEELSADSPPPEAVATAATDKTIDYLAYAKAAYQNIQQQQQTQEEMPPTTAVAEESVVEESTEPVEPPDIEAVDLDTPAWLKDDRVARLEQLTATAIEESPDLDDDFLWSAKVLADRGTAAEDVRVEEITWLAKLRQGLGKTRRGLISQVRALIGKGPLDKEAVETLELLLLQADVGLDATDYVIETLQNKLRSETLPPEQSIEYLKEIIRDILDSPYREGGVENVFSPVEDKFNVWLLTGVNGVGKTTTIGKLAHLTKQSGYSCTIAAADTFRAAAVEQVKVWGERTGVEVIANSAKNADPAAVVFDAISSAQAKKSQLLLVDTAGRLQNKKNLMEELSKIRRIVDRQAPDAQVESLLVLDATLGQNGLRQAEVFAEAAKLSGVVLTKLDGTAKGGIALAIVRELGLPIRFIGAGEGIEDLRPFSSHEFVEALLDS
jgi:fused signal recognition particle receptor